MLNLWEFKVWKIVVAIGIIFIVLLEKFSSGKGFNYPLITAIGISGAISSIVIYFFLKDKKYSKTWK